MTGFAYSRIKCDAQGVVGPEVVRQSVDIGMIEAGI